MSKLTFGIFGIVAVSAALGAVPFAAGSDLQSFHRQAGQVEQTESAANVVNRDAKGDRGQVKPGAGIGRTISFRIESGSGTSVLLRLPAAPAVETARNSMPLVAPRPAGSMLACEPTVSVLAAIAKQLPPGRCVT